MATQKRTTGEESSHAKQSAIDLLDLEDEIGARVDKARGILWLLSHLESFSDEVPSDTCHLAAWAAADLLREAGEMVRHISKTAKKKADFAPLKSVEVSHG